MTEEGTPVHSIMTEDRLDESLAALCPELPFTDEVRARIRARAGLAQEERPVVTPPRSRRRWIAVAAVAAALAVAGLAIRPLLGDDFVPAASAAATRDLERAAVVAEAAQDPAPGPGEYLYIGVQDTSLGSATTGTGKPLSALIDTTTQVWIPADRQQEWMKRTRSDTPTRWLVGSEDLAKREGDGGLLDPEVSAPSEVRAPCGDFPGWNGDVGAGTEPGAHVIGGGPCAGYSGDWGHETPEFLAGLPTDPQQLYDRMLADIGSHDPREVLGLAASVLRSGQATSDVRTNLYRALMLVPGLDVTDGAANLAGRTGVGLGIAGDNLRTEIVLDPATGRYLGDRVVLPQPGTGMWQGIPAGTVVSSSAVTTSIVRGIGSGPR
jgi:hypothetical protein